jgi:hypothetical protein
MASQQKVPRISRRRPGSSTAWASHPKGLSSVLVTSFLLHGRDDSVGEAWAFGMSASGERQASPPPGPAVRRTPMEEVT